METGNKEKRIKTGMFSICASIVGTIPMINFTIAAVICALHNFWVCCGFFMLFSLITIPQFNFSSRYE